MKLLTKSDKILKGKGFQQLGSADENQHGLFLQEDLSNKNIIYTIHKKDGEIYFVRAKKYVYRGLAPFGAGHVDSAIEHDANLMIYFDDREAHYIFDPEFVKEKGRTVYNKSKRSDRRKWLEVQLDDGRKL